MTLACYSWLYNMEAAPNDSEKYVYQWHWASCWQLLRQEFCNGKVTWWAKVVIWANFTLLGLMNPSTKVPSHCPCTSQENTEHPLSPDTVPFLVSSTRGQSWRASHIPVSGVQDHQWQSWSVINTKMNLDKLINAYIIISAEVNTICNVIDNRPV